MTDIPILDIDSWVRRPVEERHRETEQKGRVRRPMNSFMLYRWANTESIKRQSHRHNPRAISSIAGKCWRNEPQSVRDKYSRLAEIERDGHAEAHPNYKFKRKARKRRSATKPVAHRDSPEISEHNSGDCPLVQDFEMGIQSPINYLRLGSHPEGILEDLVAPMGGDFQGSYSSGFFALPDEAHHHLLCLEPINPTTSIFIDGSYMEPQWQESLWQETVWLV
ncbi:High mobility group superfamily [Penicillium canescens]|uniref:High mobility group superfamily protein n=1 Tax=Penicillium canescens TaxID=5083 RepID=A0AAD6N7K7_PENCN|nr:High mobility group superfamily [Penicillium canescens]KAJ6038419.1 High mobility group superfamily protein [Penicillium canescens]KAJ6068182.1 High mobility group superfamily [Penicillium canescens]